MVEDEAKARANHARPLGGRAPRFLWKTDREGRFIETSHQLADVVGQKNADLLGRSVAEAAQALALGDAFPAAVASQKSWSAVEVHWPLDEPGTKAPVTLGGLPIFDEARRFAGFNGYGLFDLGRATSCEAPATVAPPAAPAQQAPTFEAPAPANVVPLRPHLPAWG